MTENKEEENYNNLTIDDVRHKILTNRFDSNHRECDKCGWSRIDDLKQLITTDDKGRSKYRCRSWFDIGKCKGKRWKWMNK